MLCYAGELSHMQLVKAGIFVSLLLMSNLYNQSEDVYKLKCISFVVFCATVVFGFGACLLA